MTATRDLLDRFLPSEFAKRSIIRFHRAKELSRYLGHSTTDVTRRNARQTPEALGIRAADALGLAGPARDEATS